MQELNHFQINLQQVTDVMIDLLVDTGIEPLPDKPSAGCGCYSRPANADEGIEPLPDKPSAGY